MLDQEEIDNQQKLLETQQRTLAHYIRQQAALGFLAPPGVTHSINEAREEIRLIKAALREQGVDVRDLLTMSRMLSQSLNQVRSKRFSQEFWRSLVRLLAEWQ